MKKLKLIASAVALVATASQANATVYDISGSFNVALAGWNIPFTINSGMYDDVTGTGTWNMFADFTSIPSGGTMLYDQNFTMNAATGTGVPGRIYNCFGSSPTCSVIAPLFEGSWTGTPAPIGAGLNFWTLPTANGPAVFQPYLTAQPSTVPIPAAAWLFGSAVLSLAGLGHRRSKG